MKIKTSSFFPLFSLLAIVAILSLLMTLPGCGEKKVGTETAWEEAAKTEEAAAPPPPSRETELLQNGDFSSQLQGWEIWDQGGSRAHGVNHVEIVAGPDGTNALHMTRSCPQRDGGASGLIQKIGAKVPAGSNLVLTAKIKCDYQEGGNIANNNPQWYPEGAVQIRIYYTLGDGTKGDWYHGFYYSTVPGADTEHFTKVALGEWYSYQSGSLLQEIGAAAGGQELTIDEFRVYGFGWSFDGYTAQLSLSY